MVAVVSPEEENGYYHGYATRITCALGNLDIPAVCCKLAEVPEGSLDLCILSGLSEIMRTGGEAGVFRSLSRLRKRAELVLSLSVESISSRWFRKNLTESLRADVDAVLDVGILPQNTEFLRRRRMPYLHIFDGLLASEAESLDASPGAAENDRPIPWAHIGTKDQDRVKLTDLLVSEFDPGGLVYLSEPAPATEAPHPSWNAELVERALSLTKYHIWTGTALTACITSRCDIAGRSWRDVLRSRSRPIRLSFLPMRRWRIRWSTKET